MALITCPECGKEISDKSNQCINCGFPLGFVDESGLDVSYYKIVLISIDDKYKSNVYRAVMELAHKNILDVNNLLKSLPQVIQKGLTIEECNEIQKLFQSIGAITEIKEDMESVLHNRCFERMTIRNGTIKGFELNKTCEHCGHDNWFSIDSDTSYVEICKECNKSRIEYNKQRIIDEFECEYCGSLIGNLEENSRKMGVRCSNCGKLKIFLHKHYGYNLPKNNQNNSMGTLICPHCGSTAIMIK